MDTWRVVAITVVVIAIHDIGKLAGQILYWTVIR